MKGLPCNKPENPMKTGTRAHTSATKMEKKVAEKILANPDQDVDANPEVIAALVSVISSLENRGGRDLTEILELAKAAVASAKLKSDATYRLPSKVSLRVNDVQNDAGSFFF
jgi:hypothetical protein